MGETSLILQMLSEIKSGQSEIGHLMNKIERRLDAMNRDIMSARQHAMSELEMRK